MIKEKFIDFAIDNCDKFGDFDYKRYEKIKVYKNYIHLLDDYNCKYSSDNLIEVITSKPFIKAVARGILKDKEYIDIDFGKIGDDNCSIKYSLSELSKPQKEKIFKNIIFDITLIQAIAIRENKLDEFMEILITKK